MNKFVTLSDERRGLYFEQAADRLGLHPGSVEKDFWVVWVLDKLFQSTLLSNKIIFKGGTSLSKVFGLIERFSEDIDLILDWNLVVMDDPYLVRSNTKQDRFNKAVPDLSRQYIAQTFLPEVQRLLRGICSAEIEDGAPDVINIKYPSNYKSDYLRPEIRLEIGPLAMWTPNERYEIRSYVAEVFPYVFDEPFCHVQAIKAERTFWEKATILHAEAFRPETKRLPVRYSRHYYDLVMMAADPDVKQAAFSDRNLLQTVVEFKTKFYPASWANYDLATPGTFKLLPPANTLKALADDYRQMQIMFFGDVPEFDDLVKALRGLEADINALTPFTLSSS